VLPAGFASDDPVAPADPATAKGPAWTDQAISTASKPQDRHLTTA